MAKQKDQLTSIEEEIHRRAQKLFGLTAQLEAHYETKQCMDILKLQELFDYILANYRVKVNVSLMTADNEFSTPASNATATKTQLSPIYRVGQKCNYNLRGKHCDVQAVVEIVRCFSTGCEVKFLDVIKDNEHGLFTYFSTAKKTMNVSYIYLTEL